MVDAATTQNDNSAPAIDLGAFVDSETRARITELLDRCETLKPAIRELAIEAHRVFAEVDQILDRVEIADDEDGEIRRAMSDGLLEGIGRFSGADKLRMEMYALTEHLYAGIGDPSVSYVDWLEVERAQVSA